MPKCQDCDGELDPTTGQCGREHAHTQPSTTTGASWQAELGMPRYQDRTSHDQQRQGAKGDRCAVTSNHIAILSPSFAFARHRFPLQFGNE